MRELFNSIRNTEDFEGLLLFSTEGELIYEESLVPPYEKTYNKDSWQSLVRSLNGIREAQMTYEKGRVYVRETAIGYLMVLTGMFAPTAKIRLYCDVLLPTLNDMKESKGLKRFFKKRK